MGTNSTAAVVGAAGGVGATRLAVELGATLALDGRDVAVFDAAYATQGLSDHVGGRIDPDVTELVTDPGLDVADALVPLPGETAGRFVACPAYAPFERLARAKTADAAAALGDVIDRAAGEFDHVLVDTPPVAANQAVAAVSTADAVAIVAPPTTRGRDALQRTRGRLADVGAAESLVVANRSDGDSMPDADLAVPEDAATDVPSRAACLDARAPFAPAVAAVAEALFDASLDVDFEGGLFDAARRRLE